MKKYQNIIILTICIIVIIGGGIIFIKNNNLSFLQGKSSSTPPPAPHNNGYYTFPNNNPQFSVKINSKRTSHSSSYIRQQAITVYKYGQENDKSVFQRSYSADGFNGSKLLYMFATDSASFTQEGTLETLDCPQADCSLPWDNFYIWDAKKNTFVLDNVSHTNDFTQLLNTYKTIDIQGVPSANNTLLLKAEKVIQEIINGENLSSNDINNTSL